MKQYIVNEVDLTLVADTIREKAGTTDQLVFPHGFVGGMFDVQAAMLNKTLTRIANDSVDSLVSYALYGYTLLQSAYFPSVTVVGSYTFNGCKSLTDVYLPMAYDIGSYAFSNCSSLRKIMFERGSTIGVNAFSGCTELETIVCGATSIGGIAFSGCTNLKNVVLRNTNRVCTFGTNAFRNTPFTTGEGIDFYVPDALMDAYTTALQELGGTFTVRPLEAYFG